MRKAFTLVELLIVIAIISILSVVVVVAMNGAQTKSRDTKRKADLKALSAALESYKSFRGTYPKISACAPYDLNDISNFSRIDKDVPCASINELVVLNYISSLPLDPAKSNLQGYFYTDVFNGANYKIIKPYPEMLDGQSNMTECKKIADEFYDPARPCRAYQVNSNAEVTKGL